MKVTAVVTCYESNRTIGMTLMSLAGQSRKPDELIVTDDGSSAATCEYVSRLLDVIAREFGIATEFCTHARRSPYRPCYLCRICNYTCLCYCIGILWSCWHTKNTFILDAASGLVGLVPAGSALTTGNSSHKRMGL